MIAPNSFRRLLVALVVAGSTAVVAELGFRLYASFALPEYTTESLEGRAATLREAADRSIDEGVEEEEKLPVRIPHPYFGWIGTPGAMDLAMSPRVLRILSTEPGTEWIGRPRNNAGFISPFDYPYEKQPDDFVVMVIGGSVARWFAILGDETFEATLEKDPRLAGKHVVVINASAAGFKQPQQLMVAAFEMVLGLDPDVVINLDGFNDVVFAAENVEEGVDAAFPPLRYWSWSAYGDGLSREMTKLIADVENARAAALRSIESVERWTGVCNLLAFVQLRRAERFEALADERELLFQDALAEHAKVTQAAIVRGPRGGRDVDETKVVVDLWERSSRVLHAMCSAQGITYVHALQPTPHDWADGKPKVFTPFEIDGIGPHDHPLAQAVERLYPHLRERGRALAADGIDFLDLTRMFADYSDSAYYDLCHLTYPANQLLAERIADAVLAALD